MGERKNFTTWDEAFRSLAPMIRQQSVRVASYTQVLFLQACASSYGTGTPEGADRMRAEYGDLAYKCGLYHQLGKALVPEEYQISKTYFSDEEKALYRKYTTDGRLLVAKLQELGNGTKEAKITEDTEIPTKKIAWLMLRETCEQHMERWDGYGYPSGRIGNEISCIAQIVGLAKELDRISSETKSENPFDEAYVALLEQSGKAFSEELIEVLKAAKGKCRGVYKKYIHYTKTLPKTIHLVDKRKERPMGLLYRPMMAEADGKIVAYEAVPWFGGILGQPTEKEDILKLEPMFIRTKMIDDITLYLLYEAADTVVRLNNCRIETEGVLVPVLGGFYEGESQWHKLEQLFKDQPIDMSKLMLTVPEQLLLQKDPMVKANLIQYIENGVRLVLDDYHPENMSIQEIQEIGFNYVRLAPELYLHQETANAMTLLRNQGMTLVGGSADNYDIMTWLHDNGVVYASGTLTGVLVTEDDLIRDKLLSER